MRTRILQCIFFLAAISGSAFAEVPQLINYQGTLTGSEGELLGVTGISTHRLEFSIYSDAGGSKRIWGPQVFAEVPVVNGFFNVILGERDVHGTAIVEAFSDDTAYVGVGVDGGEEISPRQRVLSAPYAATARSAVTASHHQNIIPVGTIQAFFLNSEPVGWLFCDGRSLNDPSLDDPDYQPLKDALRGMGFENLPDLRGMFLRGRDSFETARGARGEDPAGPRALGDYQRDAFQGHRHGVQYRGGALPGGNYFGMFANDYLNGAAPNSIEHVVGPVELVGFGAPRLDNETRPENIAVNYMIKY